MRRQLRRSATDAERVLWHLLRDRQLGGAKLRRQYQMGRYILDFFCPERCLAVEADGGQHFTEEGLARDHERTSLLDRQGVRVLRFSDRQIVLESDAVRECILEALRVEVEPSGDGEPSP